MNNWIIAGIGVVIIIFYSCGPDLKNRPLPKLGEKEIVNGDTLYHKIPEFSFIDQDSNIVTNETLSNSYYVADFFFTSCPTICPKVKAQMLRIYDRFEGVDSLKFLSHSIDTKRDSVPVLKEYATKLDIDSDRWHLVTGKKEDIYGINEAYFIAAMEAEDAPGGFDHSGKIVLVDKNRHVRSFADGTDPEAVNRFMEDIEKLLNE